MDRSLPERFWSFVDRNGPTMPGVDTRCWVWTGGKDKAGYGKFSWQGRTISSHRAAFLLAYGKEPKVVCHKCGNPSCVRPEHLYAGDVESNLIDIMLNRIRKDKAA